MSVIKDFMTALSKTTNTGMSALDDAIAACSNYSNITDVKTHLVSDAKKVAAETFLKDYCGINLYNEDTGSITGKDAGGSVTKTQSSVVPESGSIDRTFTDNSFTVNGLTLRLGDETTIDSNQVAYKDFKDFKDLNKKEQYIWQALHSWWVEGSLDLNAESYGNKFSFTNQSSASVKQIIVYFTNKTDSKMIAGVTPWYNGNKASWLDLEINMATVNSIQEDNVDGKFTSNNGDIHYFDNVLAHEFTHAVMAANLPANAYRYMPAFAREGLAELTCGIDQEKKESIQDLAKNPDELENYLSSTDTAVHGDYGKPYAAGYILFRYLNKQVSSSGNDTVHGGGTDTIPSDSRILQKNDNVYTYGNGNRTIGGYQEGEVVRLDDYQGLDDISGNSFYIKSKSGRLDIQNCHGKWVGYSAGNSEVLAYSHVASGSSTVDGRTRSQAEILIGSASGSNSIVSGTGDSSLWGGSGGNDTLVGGTGYNEYFYTIGNGNDVIQGAESKDLVNLLGVSFNQISGYSSDSNSTTIHFNDGGSLRVEGSSTIDYLIGGQKYWYGRYSGKMFKS